MDFKKGVGEFFKPKNSFSRAARLGGAALGFAGGGPQGASMGYELGDKLAGTWEDDGEDDGVGASDFLMRGKAPAGAAGGAGGIMNFFNRSGNGNSGIDLATILKLAQMSGGM